MNKTSYIIVAITILIIAGFGYFVSYKQARSAYQTYNDISKIKSDLAQVSQKKTILENLSKNNELNTLYDIASKYIPTQADSSQLILELSAIAATNNLKVDQFSLENSKTNATTSNATDTTTTKTTDKTAPTTDTSTTKTDTSTTKADSNISELPFSMKVSGGFIDFLAFLGNVQTCSRLVTITSMNLLQDTNGFSSDVAGKAYYQKVTSTDQNLNNINISQEIINRFQNLKTYGTPIDLPTESGFGRSNPFDQVK